MKTPPGAVVLDMAIAPTQGWNVLKMLKENPSTQAIPLLFYSLAEDKGAMLELDYLTKPVGVAELGRVLEYQKLTVAESDKSVTEIAMEVGFSDSGYFSRVFRQQVGKSPDAYRRT